MKTFCVDSPGKLEITYLSYLVDIYRKTKQLTHEKEKKS